MTLTHTHRPLHRLTERTVEAEVENLRIGLSALPKEPELINEVALCLAYLSLGEHGRAALAIELVEEFREQINVAASRLPTPRRAALESLLRRIETISQIQATRDAMRLGNAMMAQHRGTGSFVVPDDLEHNLVDEHLE